VAYKENVYMMASAKVGKKTGFDQYSCGEKRIKGLQGAWADAEDSILSMNPVANGSVDSVGAVHFDLEPNATETVFYWISFAAHWPELLELDATVLSIGPDRMLNQMEHYWRYWLHKQLSVLTPVDISLKHSPTCRLNDSHEHSFADLGDKIDSVYRRSVLLLRANWSVGGAFIAAVDNAKLTGGDHYAYFWPRDGAFCAHAANSAGHGDMALEMLRLSARLLTEDGYLLHKYNPSGSLASSWHPKIGPSGERILRLQEDETALVVLEAWNHLRVHRNTSDYFEGANPLYWNLISPAANFMASYLEPHTGLPGQSYDLGEERRGIMSFTTASVYAALKAAARLGRIIDDQDAASWSAAADKIKEAAEKHLYNEHLGRFVRGVTVSPEGHIQQDLTIDASVFGLWYFGMFDVDDLRIERTMQAVETRLWVRTGFGGIARYEGDNYERVCDNRDEVPGNPWVICTLWVAQWYIQKAKTRQALEKARKLIDWCAAKTNSAGLLAEQYHPYTGVPLSVSPLTWSHSQYILAVREYAAKYQILGETNVTADEDTCTDAFCVR
jgi:GH15 family glucan-1,4-alpha-glucosidase